MQLLIAHTASSRSERVEAIDASILSLKRAANVAFYYDLACALSKKSELIDGPEKAAMIREAKEYLLSTLKTLANTPYEPEIDAIPKDPFLTELCTDEDVRDAIKDLKWAPRSHDLVPPSMVDYVRGQLWLCPFPLKGARFSRFNGDNRVP